MESSEDKKKINEAKAHTNCFASAAMAINMLHGRGRLLDCPTVMQELIESAKKVNSGNLNEIEQMLMTQAKSLDYIFYDAMSKLADLNMINQIETFVSIALRAQSQCRKTLATLAEIKHPKRTTFIQQQNNAVQVNQLNSKNSKNFANEMISEVNLEKMDTRSASTSVRTYPKTEAMVICDRS